MWWQEVSYVTGTRGVIGMDRSEIGALALPCCFLILRRINWWCPWSRYRRTTACPSVTVQAQLLGPQHQWRKCWQKSLQINGPSLCVSDSPLEDTDPKDSCLIPKNIMAEPDYIEDDNPELIKPQKLINPVKTSRNHQDLHRELLMNQKRYGSFLNIFFLLELLR